MPLHILQYTGQPGPHHCNNDLTRNMDSAEVETLWSTLPRMWLLPSSPEMCV